MARRKNNKKIKNGMRISNTLKSVQATAKEMRKGLSTATSVYKNKKKVLGRHTKHKGHKIEVDY